MGIAGLKPLELRVRRMLMSRQRRFTGGLVTGTADAIDLGTAPRILFVRAERIGDVLISIPVIRAVRRRYPGAVIDLLVSSANAGVVPAVRPWVDHVWRYDKRIGPGVRAHRCDDGGVPPAVRLAGYRHPVLRAPRGSTGPRPLVDVVAADAGGVTRLCLASLAADHIPSLVQPFRHGPHPAVPHRHAPLAARSTA